MVQANVSRHDTPFVEELIRRTEGWPVGLLLLKQLLEQRSGTRASLDFSGSRIEVANYLNKSLFQSAPKERQNFLVALAHLDSFSPEMISVLFDDPGRAHDLLSEVNNNSFIVQDSDATQTFRFHLMFQEFLKDQKTSNLNPSLSTFLVRACDWHVQRGETALAVGYALRIGDEDRIIQLLSDYSESELGNEGNAQLFVDWIREAENLGCTLSPNLSYWYQWCLIFGGHWRQVQDEEIGALPSREQTVIRAVHSIFSDDQDGLIASVAAWKNGGEFGNELTNSGMYGASAICELGKGDFRRAQTELNRAMFSVERSTSIFARCWLMVLDSFLALYRGRIIDAETHAWKAVNLAEHRLIDNRGVNRLVRQIASLMTWYRGYDFEAREEFGNVPSANQEFGLPAMTIMVASAMRHLKCDDHLSLPEGWLRSHATRLIYAIDKIEFQQVNGAAKSEISEQLLDLEDRVVFATESGLDFQPAFWNARNRYEILMARQNILDGDPEEALKKLMPVISRCQKDSNALLQNHAELLRAAALWQFDKHHEAQRQLIRTTERAFDGGLVRPILMEKSLIEPILPNLMMAGDRATIGRDPAVWRIFKRAVGQNNSEENLPIVAEVASPGDLQLTTRELELIGFLDAGLSNQDIADRLSIKLSTVKWHLNNLFSKLDVKNRTSAARFAKDNRLL
ncbi:LuxR C-terminal-related transcriptional regulator [Tropicibacter sp. Alg240-R139]|uniref:LuxR C-terminal-related transcriptional regulator n=1 Tax=Tropicibacter sp. Alg240-R139 TaxID=2305991 RepID=UPI0013DEE7CC|nr:LuxR C-terminal-related transcriptional regulator [Tropicibacter sp. Alg240-R139]